MDPAAKAGAGPQKVGQVLWHPVAAIVPTAASSGHLEVRDHGKKLRLLHCGPVLAHSQCRIPEWSGGEDCAAAAGFSKMGGWLASNWECGGLGTGKTPKIDPRAGAAMPFWSSSGTLLLGAFTCFFVPTALANLFRASWQGSTF